MTTPPRPQATQATSFDDVATEYAASRPSYPPELLETIEEHTGIALAHAEVLDVGAGTGIASQLLNQHGAHVTAVEPGPGMARQFSITLPGMPLVRADGDALPFADESFHLVTFAQSWHWTDPARSLPEALRVLRPGGAIALWWNRADTGVPWIRAQQERLHAAVPGYMDHDVTGRTVELIDSLGLGLRPTTHELGWSREIDHATHLNNLATHSAIIQLPPAQSGPILDAEAEAVAAAFPESPVPEEYVVRLTLVPKPMS